MFRTTWTDDAHSEWMAQLPVIVQGKPTDECTFADPTRAIMLSGHGCLTTLSASVKLRNGGLCLSGVLTCGGFTPYAAKSHKALLVGWSFVFLVSTSIQKSCPPRNDGTAVPTPGGRLQPTALSRL